WARFLAPFVVLLFASCSSTPPPRPPVRELPPPATALLDIAPQSYGQTEPIALPDDRGSAAAQTAFAAAVGPTATHEPALDLVAAVVGKTFAEAEELPAHTLLQWLYWKCGAISIPGPVNVFVAGLPRTLYFAEHIQKLALAVRKAGEPLSFGL